MFGMGHCDAQTQALVPPCLLSSADIAVAYSTKMLKEHIAAAWWGVGAEQRQNQFEDRDGIKSITETGRLDLLSMHKMNRCWRLYMPSARARVCVLDEFLLVCWKCASVFE